MQSDPSQGRDLRTVPGIFLPNSVTEGELDRVEAPETKRGWGSGELEVQGLSNTHQEKPMATVV
jgi:hypothetical protein